MKIFGNLTKLFQKELVFNPADPPIPEEEKKYYQSDSYYTDIVFPGTQFERKVITFEERKKRSYPSKSGLFVAEILLLEYCSYGTYPHPRNGYPGFWWFDYGIRNVGAKLSDLEKRGYIQIDEAKGKYRLTQAGSQELEDNKYVPYMHKVKGKTTEDARFGPIFNVWEVNRRIRGVNTDNWLQVVNEISEQRENFLRKN